MTKEMDCLEVEVVRVTQERDVSVAKAKKFSLDD